MAARWTFMESWAKEYDKSVEYAMSVSSEAGIGLIL